MADIKTMDGVDFTAGGWQLCYDIDFTDYSSGGAMADGDTIAIEGTTWTANSSSKGGPEISGNGLVLSPQYESKIYNSSPANTPNLSANLSDLVPQLTSGSTVCMQWTIDYAVASGDAYPTSQFEAVGATFWNGAENGSWKGLGVKAFFITGYTGLIWNPYKGPNVEYLQSSFAGDYRSFEAVYNFDQQLAICSSPVTGSYVLDPPLSASVRRAYMNGVYGSTSTWTKQADWSDTDILRVEDTKVLLYSYIEEAGGSAADAAARGFQGIIKRFRIWSTKASY